MLGPTPRSGPTHQSCSGSYSSSTRAPSSRARCTCCPRRGHTRCLRSWCRKTGRGSLRKPGPVVSGELAAARTQLIHCPPEPQRSAVELRRLFDGVPTPPSTHLTSSKYRLPLHLRTPTDHKISSPLLLPEAWNSTIKTACPLVSHTLVRTGLPAPFFFIFG